MILPNIVEMRNITKIFPGVIANDDVNFNLDEGEIHVLLGENGAGKTTLMNILYGLYQQTSGEIFIRGEKVDMKNPNTAIEHRIGMVHQHFMLVPPFTVTENIVLGNEPNKYGKLRMDLDLARERVLELSENFGLKIDPDIKVQDISVGLQQRVEIIKALYKGADILILDEPTAVLTPQEIDELGEIIKKLTLEGKSVILITHKLKEVMSMSDRVTVIRKGKVIETLDTAATDIDSLAELMVGRKVKLEVDKKQKQAGKTILKVENLKVLDNRKIEAVKDVSFEVKTGEVLAIAGVDGNGQSQLVEAITGLSKVESGKVELAGVNIANRPTREIINMGVGHIPEDRQRRGLILEHTLAENMILGYHHSQPFSKRKMMDYNAVARHGKNLIKEFDIRTPGEQIQAKSLSGGNQQKVIIAREFYKNPKLLIAAQPTRGLDVGAIEFVHKRLIDQRNDDKGVLLISLELDEVMSLADRIAVIYDGRIVGIVDARDTTERELGIMMAGGKPEKEMKDE